MTRHLLDKPIPKRVLCPVNEELNQPAREADVLGISVLDRCLNPNCNREGPLDALILGPLNVFPNLVIICGDEQDGGCGVFWAMTGGPPAQTMWLGIDENDDPEE